MLHLVLRVVMVVVVVVVGWRATSPNAHADLLLVGARVGAGNPRPPPPGRQYAAGEDLSTVIPARRLSHIHRDTSSTVGNSEAACRGAERRTRPGSSMGRNDRPELTAPPEVFYNDDEARKYTDNTRIMDIQTALTERALELLSLPDDGTPKYILDLGCGSGLSGECLTDANHIWLVSGPIGLKCKAEPGLFVHGTHALRGWACTEALAECVTGAGARRRQPRARGDRPGLDSRKGFTDG